MRFFLIVVFFVVQACGSSTELGAGEQSTSPTDQPPSSAPSYGGTVSGGSFGTVAEMPFAVYPGGNGSLYFKILLSEDSERCANYQMGSPMTSFDELELTLWGWVDHFAAGRYTFDHQEAGPGEVDASAKFYEWAAGGNGSSSTFSEGGFLEIDANISASSSSVTGRFEFDFQGGTSLSGEFHSDDACSELAPP